MSKSRIFPLDANTCAGAQEARFALQVTSRLSAQSAELPLEIAERLRIAREHAMGRAREVRAAQLATEGARSLGSVLAWLGDGRGSRWWIKFGSALPLAALIVGLMAIQEWHDNNEILAAAEIDASLLADDLPPSAYSDPGFAEFLYSPRE